MDNERPNEHALWNRRLEEPGALPGTGLADKEAAWDKLYDRLKESEAAPRRKRMIWLWTAAACLLLIVVPAALLLKNARTFPHAGPEKIPSDISSAKKPSTRQGDPSSAVPAHPLSGQPLTGQPGRTHAHRPARNQAHPPAAHPDLNKLFAHGADTLTLVFAPRPDLSKPPPVAALVPVKKEQRVVHINELEPPQPTPATAKGPRRKPGGLRIGPDPQETYRPSTTFAEPEPHSILSLKHAQNP
jgi:hypothetical protein